MRDLLAAALDAATSSGASYADVRGVESRSESIGVKGPAVESLDRFDSLGFGVRVLVGGAWGYACSARLDPAEAVATARTAVEIAAAGATSMVTPAELVPEPVHRDSWAGPVEQDPFAVSLEDKLQLLTSATAGMQVSPNIKTTRATMDLLAQKIWFVSSEGSSIDQSFVQSAAGIEAVAVDGSEVQQRSYPGSFRGHFASGGYEVITDMDLVANAEQTGSEAVALLSAPPCPTTVTSVVLDGHQTMLQVHESVGHPTELDRVLGMEAAFAGTSFVGIPDLGSLRYGSELVNINSDATIPGGLGSYGYDDEGVAAQRVDLVKDGILVGFQTSRETAAKIGADRSNGTMRAEGWENFPLIRMPNINLLPVEGSFEDLLAGVDDGIYMATNKSWSIDDKRLNFQFGCEIAWEIKKGKLERMLKDPRYTGITPEFWGSCDGIAGPEEWKVWGTPNCGKGQPGQTMRVGHGTSPARFRNVSTGVSS